MAQIIIKNLRKDFGAFTAVQSSSFTIEDGEFFMLLGPSGCGKTTTLRMIAGLELPSAGEIYINGEEVSQKPASQRDIAFVFQMFALYPHMNVRKNISYPLVSQGMPRDQVRAKVAEVAEILGITGILDKPVGGLSGGGSSTRRPWPRHCAGSCLFIDGRTFGGLGRRVSRVDGAGIARPA